MVSFDEKAGAYRITNDLRIEGKRVRKTKLLPTGITLEVAQRIDEMSRSPRDLLKDRLMTAVIAMPAASGEVYAIKNEYLPGLVKIGMSRNSVHERIRNLNTAYPVDWQIVAVAPVRHAVICESVLHSHLAAKRVNQNREFFSLERGRRGGAAKRDFGD